MHCRTPGQHRSASLPFALAASAFVLLLIVEPRLEAPLVDLSFFTRRGFVLGVTIGSLSMFSMMTLLLYFNLYAQSREGLGLTPLQAGALLLPLGATLLALALSASARSRKGRATQCDDRWLGADRYRQCHHRACHRAGRDGAAGDRVCCDWSRSGRAVCLGTTLGTVGSFAHASGTGFGCHQRLHLSWRQRRDCRWRVSLCPRRFPRGSRDDCARRYAKRRDQPLDWRDDRELSVSRGAWIVRMPGCA